MRFIIPVLAFLLLCISPVSGQNQENPPPESNALADDNVLLPESSQALLPIDPESALTDTTKLPEHEQASQLGQEQAQQQAAALHEQARAAYARRDNIDSLMRSIEFFQQARALDPDNPQLGLEYTAAILWLEGYHYRGSINEVLIQEGMAITTNVLQEQPDNALAHYIHGLLNGFHGKYVNSLGSFAFFNVMEEELNWVEEHDNSFDYGGIYRAWGNYYAQLPGLLGGDLDKAEIYYLHAMEMFPEYYLNNILLALLYSKQEKWQPAYDMLRAVIDSPAPPSKELVAEWNMWKERAIKNMASLRAKAPSEVEAAFAANYEKNNQAGIAMPAGPAPDSVQALDDESPADSQADPAGNGPETPSSNTNEAVEESQPPTQSAPDENGSEAAELNLPNQPVPSE